MDNSSANIDLIRSHVDIIILKPLESKDRYGYEILKEIDTNSNGLFSLKQPTLYSCLKRLEKQGYINSYLGDESNGAQRRYYSLTQQGRDFLESQQSQWEFVRTILSGLVSDVDFDKDKDIKPFDPSKYRPLTKRTRSDDEEEEKVKVVEKVVYVPVENEQKPLTSDEIKEKLTDDDINDIVQDYLKTHNLETKEEDTTDVPSALDDYVDNIPDDEPQKESFFKDYDKMCEEDNAVEEDVALTAEDEFNTPFSTYQMNLSDIDKNIYNDKSYEEEDLPPVVIESFENESVLNELTLPQNNDIKEDDNEFIEDRTPLYARHNVSEEDLIEEKPRYVSYTSQNEGELEDNTPQINDDAYNDDEPIHYNTFKNVEKTVYPEQELIKKQSKVDDSTSLFDYSRTIEEPKIEEKQEDSINVFKALDRIYAVNDTKEDKEVEDIEDDISHDNRYYDSQSSVYYNTTNDDNTRIETISELKAKLQNEGFKVKPYTKINSSEFYVNNYYYANRTSRDTSLIMFAIFFIESLLAHFILATKFELNFGYLALTWGVAALVPIFFTVKWAIAPYYKKHTRVSLRLSLMLGLIALLNAALIIFLVGFFGFGAEYNNIDTMILPIITPLVFLINIPLYSLIYYMLYKTKRYNLR